MATTNLDAIVEATSTFSCKFLEAILSEKGNMVSSPLSCLIALAMAHTGAKGETAEIMSKGLSLPSDLKLARQGFNELIHNLTTSEQIELSIANKIYVKTGFSIKKVFSSALKKSFNASGQNVDFLDDATIGIINDWVAQQTKEKIKNLIKPDSFDDTTRLVLVNAVYFKGNWLNPFAKTKTSEREFFTTKTKKVKSQFMYQQESFPYASLDDLDAKLLELPYKGYDFTMVVILPNKRTGLAALEKKLATRKLSELLQQTVFTEVKVYLPKFKIETTLDLKHCLSSKMELEQMFSNAADFSGISTSSPEEPLIFSKVIHKAVIEVSEEATEAAAATAIEFMVGCALAEEPEIVDCDHPFAYYLTYKHQATLFGGRLAQP